MTSGNLRANERPGGFSATGIAMTSRVLICSILATVGMLFASQDAMAQCAISPTAGTTATQDATLSPNAECVRVTQTFLLGATPSITFGAGNDPDCELYFVNPDPTGTGLDSFLMVADTASFVKVCCGINMPTADGDTLLVPEGIYEIVADDDGSEDPDMTGSVFWDITILDITAPAIDTMPGAFCDSSYVIQTDSVYNLTAADSMLATGADATADCSSDVDTILNPVWDDACGIDSASFTISPPAGSATINFPGGSAAAPGSFGISFGGAGVDSFWSFYTDVNLPILGDTCDTDYEFTIIVMDEAGNADTCSYSITVVDSVPPMVMGPMDDTVSTDIDICAYTIPDGRYDATATDNCAVATLTHNYPIGLGEGFAPFDTTLAGAIIPIGTDTIIWTAVDNCGNTAMDTFIITVNDSVPPVITCPFTTSDTLTALPDTIVGTSEDGVTGDCIYTVNGTTFDATATDNCAVDTVFHNYAPAPSAGTLDGADFPKGSYTITWVAIDTSGNTDTCMVEIVVLDDEPPLIADCPAPDTISTSLTDCEALHFWEAPDSLLDNCGLTDFSVVAFDEAGNPIPVGSADPVDCNSQLGFAGEWTPSLWTVDTTMDADFDASDAPDSVKFVLNEPPAASLPGNADQDTVCISMTVPESGLIAFNWERYPFFDPAPVPYYVINNNPPVDLTDQGLVEGNPNGSAVFPVSAGDELSICFRDVSADTICIPVPMAPPICFPVCPPCEISQSEEHNFVISNFQFTCAGSENFASFPVGTNTVRYTLTDCGGNVDTCDYLVTVVDSIPPVARCLGDTLNVVLESDGEYELLASALDNNSTDNCGIVLREIAKDGINFDETQTFDCSELGIDTVWMRVEDAEGNADTCMTVIEVLDLEDPTIVCQNANVYLDAMGNGSVSLSDLIVSLDDNCTIVDTLVNDTTFTCADVGLNSVLITVIDQSGNASVCDADVLVIDDLAPTIVDCPADINLTLSNGCDTTLTWTEPTATDNCGPATLVVSTHSPGETFGVGTTVVRYVFEDVNGNFDTCSFTIFINDQENPLLACTPSTKPLDECGEVFFTSADLITLLQDDCGIDTIEFTVTNQDGSITTVQYDTVFLNCDFLGINTVTVRVTDFAGNTAQCTTTATVFDDIAPAVNCPDDFTITTSDVDGPTGDCYADTAMVFTFDYVCPPGNADLDDFEFFDNDSCGLTVTYVVVNLGSGNIIAIDSSAGTDDLSFAGVNFPLGDNEITLTAEDGSGNTGTCSFILTVEDDEDPVAICAPDGTRGTSEDGVTGDCIYTVQGNEFDATATDNCSVISLTHDYAGAPSNTTLDGADLEAGVHMIVWTAVDTMNNTDTCIVTITVVDDEDPMITCAADASRGTSEDGLGLFDCFYTVQGDEFDPLSATDNCELESVVHDFAGAPSDTTLDGAFLPRGTNVITWTATDTSGNTAACQVTIEVGDDEEPMFDANYDWSDKVGLQTCGDTVRYLALTGDCHAFVEWNRPDTGDIFDNCDHDSLLTLTETISDPTVQDGVDNNHPYDGFDSDDMQPEETFPVGVTTITYTAEDVSGNVATCVLTVIVEDTQTPSIACPDDVNLGTICGSFGIPDYASALAQVSDNCANYTITQDPAPGTTLAELVAMGDLADTVDGEQFTVVINVSEPNYSGDPANPTNDTSCTILVTITDEDAPIPDQGVAGGALPEIVAQCDTTLTAPTAHDVCGNTLIIAFATPVPLPAGASDNGDNTYTFVERPNAYHITWVYDDGTNQVEQTQVIFVGPDMNDPRVIFCPDDITVSNDPGDCSATVIFDEPLFFDNCDGDTLSADTSFRSDGLGIADPYPVGTTTVTYMYTDAAGNGPAVCTFTITVEDDEAPVAVDCQDHGPFENDPGVCSADLDIPVPTFDDNCDGDGIAGTFVSRSDGGAENDPYPVGVTTVTYEYTDAANNTTQCVFTVTVIDTEDPVITCAPDAVRGTSEDGVTGDCVYTAQGDEFDPVLVTDNCVIESVTHDYPDAPSNTTLDGATFVAEPGGFQVYTITWTATDTSGNTSTCEIQITVEDDEVPNFPSDCPDDIQAFATTNDCAQVVSWAPPYDWTDNCEIVSVVETFSDPTILPVYNYDHEDPGTIPGGLQIAQFPVGVTTVFYTATDANGNTTVCSFDVTIIDDQAPHVDCPSDQIFGSICANVPIPDYRGLAIISDNCPNWPNVTQDPAPGTLLGDIPGLSPNVGESFEVTITVTDQFPNNNTASCTFNVTLEDNDVPIPVVGLPGGQLPIITDTSCGFAPVIIEAPKALDCSGGTLDTICGILTPVNYPGVTDLGNCTYALETGFYNIDWVYEDSEGNTVHQGQQIWVIDDPEPPVAVCNDITIGLDANGQASIIADDVDGGSTDNCGIDSLSVSITEFDCGNLEAPAPASEDLVISGVIDGPLSGGLPKAVELYAINDIADLSEYGIGSANNGGGSDGEEFEFPADAVSAGTYIYVATESAAFNAWFGFNPDYTDGAISINGDDAIELFHNGVAYDVYGDINVDGSGEVWDYSDGWAYRMDNVDANWGVFEPSEWIYSGPDALDGESDNATAASPMPAGTYNYIFGDGNTVILTVTDLNGNTATCEAQVTVLDEIDPVAVCQDVTVFLDDSGEATVAPADINDGSSDNCNITGMSLSQSAFDCDDTGDNVVTLTVSDGSGNSDQCTATVTVVDDTPPVASCKDITLSLDANGEASIMPGTVNDGSSDNCSIDDMTIDISSFDCDDIGDNVVTLTVTDPSGNTDQCTATVTIIDDTPPAVTCPGDVSSCVAQQELTVVASDNCDISTIEWEITGASNASGVGSTVDFKFAVGVSTVTWTVTDVNGNVTVCSTEVDITDDIAPVPVCIDDINVPLGANGTVTLPAELFNGGSFDLGCADDLPLDFQISVNGSPFADSYTFDCSNVGDNDVVLLVTDQACNTASCATFATIQDPNGACPEPEIIVNNASGDIGDTVAVPVTVVDFVDITGVQLSMHVEFDSVAEVISVMDGALDVTASVNGNDIVVSWFGSATTLPDDEVIFKIMVELVGNVGDNSPVTIDDDPQPVEVTQNLMPIDVITQNGSVTITGGATQVAIAGNTAREWGDGVADVTVNLTGDATDTDVTDADGDFGFSVDAGSTVTVTPERDINYAEFVSIVDLVMIQEHIILEDTLDSPYKLIAADASGGGTISTFDLVLGLGVLTGNITDLPSNTSWIFIDADHVFSDPSDPWADQPWPTSITHVGIVTDQLMDDFVAIKVLDVTEPAGGPANGPQARGAMLFNLDNRSVQAGDELAISFMANDFDAITGYQMSLDYSSSALKYEGIGFEQTGLNEFNESNIFVSEDRGLINLAWFDAKGTSVEDGIAVFTLKFTATSDISDLSKMIAINDNGLDAFAVNLDNQQLALSLSFDELSVAAEEFILYQNRPNPFKGETVIGFELPRAGNATLEILDQSGRVIRQIENEYSRGYNEILVDLSGTNASGVLYYRLSTEENTAVKSMIMVD